VIFLENKPEAPHVLAPIHDPVQHGFSTGRIIAMGLLFLFGSIELATFFSYYGTKFCFLSVIALVLTILIYLVFCRDQTTLDHNWNKLCFEVRYAKGIEQIGKYENENRIIKKHIKTKTEKQVKSVVPWDAINEITGLNRGTLNSGGDWFFDLVAFPPAEQDKDTFNENLRLAFQALPFGCLQKTVLLSGRDLTFIVDDIEQQLKKEGISPVRVAELYSIQDAFKDITEVIDWIYLIHIGLSYTQDEKRAKREMDAVQNGYIRLLNDMGIGTVLIKDSDDMVLLYQSMLTGKLLYGRV
jgi:hypothetical protein